MTKDEWDNFLKDKTIDNTDYMKGLYPDITESELYWFHFGFIVCLHQVRDSLTELRFKEMMEKYEI